MKDILDAIAEVESTPVGRGIQLRMRFARLINQQLKKEGLTQKQLADRCGKFESYISNVINGNKNLTFDSAGEILFALPELDADFISSADAMPLPAAKETSVSVTGQQPIVVLVVQAAGDNANFNIKGSIVGAKKRIKAEAA